MILLPLKFNFIYGTSTTSQVMTFANRPFKARAGVGDFNPGRFSHGLKFVTFYANIKHFLFLQHLQF